MTSISLTEGGRRSHSTNQLNKEINYKNMISN